MNVEQFGKIQLVNADCMEVMRTMPDNAFDLAICDPPYGLGIDGQKECICKNPKHNRKQHDKKGWDKLPPPRILHGTSKGQQEPNHLGCELLCKILVKRHKRLDLLVQRTNRANNVRLRTCLFIL